MNANIDSEKFEIVYDEYSVSLIEAMQNYFDNAYVIFEDNKDCTLDLDKAYLIALGNRLTMVGEDLESLYNDLNNLTYVESNQTILTNINDTLKGLL